ncbi:MAG: LysM peptidoglycan-binding domain-containing protein [Actinomycetota bacterium]
MRQGSGGTRAGRAARVRRHRLLVVTVATAAVVGIWGPLAQAGGTSAQRVATRARVRVGYEVRQGDSLWGIAQRFAPAGSDVRVYVAKLQRWNGLAGGQVVAGQTLVVATR